MEERSTCWDRFNDSGTALMKWSAWSITLCIMNRVKSQKAVKLGSPLQDSNTFSCATYSAETCHTIRSTCHTGLMVVAILHNQTLASTEDCYWPALTRDAITEINMSSCTRLNIVTFPVTFVHLAVISCIDGWVDCNDMLWHKVSLLSLLITLESASRGNWCTVGGDGECRVGEVRAGTTSPMPDHKGFKLQ